MCVCVCVGFRSYGLAEQRCAPGSFCYDVLTKEHTEQE